ncbi:MAG: AraC family transcriptional regulator [Lachnospiraceae bacterium]
MTKHDLDYINLKYFHVLSKEKNLIRTNNKNATWYEIFYLISGDVICKIDHQEFILEPDSIFITPPFMEHELRTTSDTPFERAAIFFPGSIIPAEYQHYLTQTFTHRAQSHSYVYQHVSEFHIPSYFDMMEAYWDMDEDIRNTSAYILVESILSALIYIDRSSGKVVGANKEQHLMNEILQYINENLASNLSLDQLSNKFYINKNKLYDLFRQSTNQTIKQYITYKRIIKAEKLIKNGTPLNIAASEVGYQDYSTFYRAYKKVLGVTPNGNGPHT